MCFFAISIFRLNSSSLRLDLLRFCSPLNIVQGGLPISIKGLDSRTSALIRALTSLLQKSHGLPVSGSFRVRSRLHPGFRVVPPYVLRAASCAILGCEYTSETSAPFPSNSFRAPSMISSTLMSSASFMRLCRILSGVSLTMQSSITLPVVRLLITLLCTSCSRGPPFDVVTMCLDLGNVLANTPDPMCLQDKSALSIRSPCRMGPGCCERLAMSSALSSLLASSFCIGSFLFWPFESSLRLRPILSASSASSSAVLFWPLSG